MRCGGNTAGEKGDGGAAGPSGQPGEKGEKGEQVGVLQCSFVTRDEIIIIIIHNHKM